MRDYEELERYGEELLIATTKAAIEIIGKEKINAFFTSGKKSVKTIEKAKCINVEDCNAYPDCPMGLKFGEIYTVVRHESGDYWCFGGWEKIFFKEIPDRGYWSRRFEISFEEDQENQE